MLPFHWLLPYLEKFHWCDFVPSTHEADPSQVLIAWNDPNLLFTCLVAVQHQVVVLIFFVQLHLIHIQLR